MREKSTLTADLVLFNKTNRKYHKKYVINFLLLVWADFKKNKTKI